VNRRRLAPRYSRGNVTYLKAPELISASAWPWMAWHATWWATTSPMLGWRAISTYVPPEEEGMAITSPVLLKDDTRWLYGSRVGAEWFRFGEGGSYPIEGFEPTHWAVPCLDDSILLSQE
jgi:hypothetical protein